MESDSHKLDSSINSEEANKSPVKVRHRLLRQQPLLALMLLALHMALILNLQDPLSRAMLLSHAGFFLMWQPLWRGEQRLQGGQMLAITAGGILLIVAGSWWLISLWLSILFALIGGNVPGIKNFGQRLTTLLAALYLLTILLVWAVPHLFTSSELNPLMSRIVQYGAPFLLVGIFFIRVDPDWHEDKQAVDLFYSLLLFFMVVVLVLGAFVIKEVSHGNYLTALAQTLIVIAVLIFVLSWLWDPRAGFAGIGQLVTRYFLSIGVPFESWMLNLANFADRERDPERLLALGANELASLSWVSGLEWESAEGRGFAGRESRNETECNFEGVKISVFTPFAPSPALMLHIRLLARLLADYYVAKRREQDQRRNAYLQAIHETGARLTHDVKNLLQSMRSLCSAAEDSVQSEAEALRQLMQRQLPQITQRLQTTLDKLSEKPRAGVDQTSARLWWEGLKQRYGHEALVFETGSIPEEAVLLADLYDSVADNLVQNALTKRRHDGRVRIHVRLDWEGGLVFSVCDNGHEIPTDLARQLLVAPVPSRNGLGVGLFQAARYAAQYDLTVTIATNRNGRVCFALAAGKTKDAGESKA
jgi:signal transduction histidine kinase